MPAPAKWPDRWVRLRYPSDFATGLKRLADLAGWRVKHRGEETLVCTDERYHGTHPHLIRAEKVCDARGAAIPSSYRAFSSWDPQDAVLGDVSSRAIDRVHELPLHDTLEGEWVRARVLSMLASDADWPEHLRRVFMTTAEALPEASLWGIRLDPRFKWRNAAVRVLFEARNGTATLDRDRPRGAGSLLGGQVFGLQPYVEPAVLATTPWPVGISMARAGGPVVVQFGRPVAGFKEVEANDLLAVYGANFGSRDVRPISMPSVTPAGIERALEWWVTRLDWLFSEALDVSHYATDDGGYDSVAHMGVMLSLERLFVTLHTMLAQSRRQAFVRSLLMADVLDILTGLGYSSWDGMLTPGRAKARLEALRKSLPSEAADVLLFRCRLAVDALEGLHDELAARVGSPNPVPSLLRALRNSGHSFRNTVARPEHLKVLSALSSDIPDALADVAMLWVLCFMRDPHLPRTARNGLLPAATPST